MSRPQEERNWRSKTVWRPHRDGPNAKVEHASHRQVLANGHAAFQCIRHALEAVANQYRNNCHESKGCCGPKKTDQSAHLQQHAISKSKHIFHAILISWLHAGSLTFRASRPARKNVLSPISERNISENAAKKPDLPIAEWAAQSCRAADIMYARPLSEYIIAGYYSTCHP